MNNILQKEAANCIQFTKIRYHIRLGSGGRKTEKQVIEKAGWINESTQTQIYWLYLLWTKPLFIFPQIETYSFTVQFNVSEINVISIIYQKYIMDLYKSDCKARININIFQSMIG